MNRTVLSVVVVVGILCGCPLVNAADDSKVTPHQLAVRNDQVVPKGPVRGIRPVDNVVAARTSRSGDPAAFGHDADAESTYTPSRAVAPDRRNVRAALAPAPQQTVSPNPGLQSTDSSFNFLEIEVSHSEHTLKLIGYSPTGNREILYQCRVGLGASSFPTPVGVYFVTHIYDDDPWWIPPKDRAWAAGQSPSRKVYGGIMAPLLKKKQVRLAAKKQVIAEGDDWFEGPVKLDDHGYRFHGTNQPRSIGRNESHGCVRMLPDDVKKIAALIKGSVGTADRRESENGTFVLLKAPVRLNLVK
jgi:lipoprotein-anchoring transpeptidase ErfK/SrfK